MTSKEITETIELLHQFCKVDGARHFGDCHVSTFVGYREAKDGSEKGIEIAVRITDYGENAPNPNYRFRADASWDGGHADSGDGPSVKAALGSMKWFWKARSAKLAPVVVVNPKVNFTNPDTQQKPSGERPAGPAQ
jgi:hypothetical protein